MTVALVGVDIGTSSSKAVLVTPDGRRLAQAVRTHTVVRPGPGQVEMDGAIWWQEFVELTQELLDTAGDGVRVAAVGVSGMGPCTLLADASGALLRPAILYGVDTRASQQIRQLTQRLGEREIVDRCGSALTSQAVGPKLAWVAEHEPAVFAQARRLFMPSSYLVWQLTGEYVLDHHSASQAVPLYDPVAGDWYAPWWSAVAGGIEPPRLGWSGEVAGYVDDGAARATGLPTGTPVITGTIDAWSEAVSVGARGVGDFMLMYGTTMFMVATLDRALSAPPLWGTVGVDPDSHCLAAGMATSGAITSWLKDLLRSDFADLLDGAAAAGPGAHGLLMLPHFAGERTPVEDVNARGAIAGLTLSHTAGDIYRAALESTAFGVRHNLETFADAGADVKRIVAVGGGTRGGLWTQIVSDVTGREQQLRADSVGASLGAAFLAAGTVGTPDLDLWNPPSHVVAPDDRNRTRYDELYRLYRELYASTAPVSHALARLQAYDASPAAPTPKGPSA